MKNNTEEIKCVMVIDEDLPLGLIANTAAVLGVTLGKLYPQMVGTDIPDQSGALHPGIVLRPIPILKGNREALSKLWDTLQAPHFASLTLVDFCDIAQSCKAYEDYEEKMKESPQDSLSYLGLALYGEKKLVNKLTGSLPLLR